MQVAHAADGANVRERYSLYCSVCHGDRGTGAAHAQQGLVPPPRNFTDPEFGATITRERIISAVTNGIPGTAMIAWKSELSAAEIAELADYILENFVSRPAMHQAGPAILDNDEARTIYQETCSVCHGDDGKGAVWGKASLSVPPRDFTTPESRSELTRERMIVSVTNGRPGSPMPGFATQLSPVQIETIVDYVRARFMNIDASRPGAGEAMTAIDTTSGSPHGPEPIEAGYHERPLPNGLEGNFERGRSLYFVNCIECHGPAGDGNGRRAYFIFPKPRSFLDPSTQRILNKPRLFAGISDGVAGREMPAWSKVFSEQDVADVTEFVYGEFIRATASDD